MFVHEATAILNQVPGIELRLRRNTVKFNPQAIPEIDVRYRGSSIGYIEKQLMDEVWHLEDPETGSGVSEGHSRDGVIADALAGAVAADVRGHRVEDIAT